MRRVAFLSTGGTAGSAVREGVAVLDSTAVAAVSGLATDGLHSHGIELVMRTPFLLHSEQVGPGHWVRLAEEIRSMAGGVEGVVVVHGTDTAAYTAAALNYLLADVDLPVVTTGASLPPLEPGSDAGVNVRAAACAAAGLPGGSYLAFASEGGDVVVHLGTRARKRRAGPAPFVSVARRPVATVRDGRMTLVDAPPREPPLLDVRPLVDDRVVVVECHPGQRLVGLVDWAVATGMRGVLLRLYPGFTAPTEPGDCSAVTAITRAAAAGLVAAATVAEPTDGELMRYPATTALLAAGVVLLDPLPMEAALPKLMWALAQSRDAGDVASLLRTTIRGDLLVHRPTTTE